MGTGLRPRLLLLGAALLFSTGGAVIKSVSLQGAAIASWRSLVAAAALLIALPAARRLATPGPWLAGVAYAATLVLFVIATKLTTAANAIFLQSSAPLYLLLLAPLVLRESVHARDVGFLATMAAGLMLLFAGDEAPRASAPDPRTGNLLGALCGVSWALTLLGLRLLSRRDAGAPLAAVAAGNLIAGLVTLPFVFPIEAVGTQDVALLLYLGVVQIGLAYVLLTRGLAGVPAVEASLLLLAEPVLNPLFAWLAHGEVPGTLAFAGCALILGATTWRTVRAGRRRRAPDSANAADTALP